MKQTGTAIADYVTRNFTAEGLISADGTWLNADPLLLEILEYPAEELIGQHWSMTCDPDQLESDLELFDKISKDRLNSCEFNKHFLTKSGKLKKVFIYLTKRQYDDLLPSGFSIAVIDISKQKEHEQLEMSERKYRNMVEHAPVPIVIHKNQVITYANKQAVSLFAAKDESELLGTLIWQYIPEDQHELVEERNVVYEKEKGLLPLSEQQIIDLNGEIKDVEVNGSYVEFAEESSIQTIFNDISDRKRIQQDLIDERRRLADILHGTNVGTWQWDISTGRITCNERWAEVLGYTLEELSPLTRDVIDSMVHPEDLQASRELANKHLQGELNQYACELRIRHKNGNWVWVFDRGKISERTRDGQPLVISGTCQDITERKHAEIKIRQANKELDVTVADKTAALEKSLDLLKREVLLRRKAEQRMSKALKEEKETTQLRSKIISCISHEFKTPLTSILSSSQLIEMMTEDSPNPKINKHLKQIESSILHMNSMISDISFMEKMGIGQIVVNKVKISLKAFLEDIIKEIGLKHTLPEFNISYEGKMDKVVSDRKLLRQILSNLISNSVKYSNNNKPVTIAFKKLKKGFEFTVADQGMGIPKEEQSNIFEYFFRADNIGTVDGTGVGLAIVKSATDMLKGSVHFESKENVGTTFNVYLPE